MNGGGTDLVARSLVMVLTFVVSVVVFLVLRHHGLGLPKLPTSVGP